MDRRYHLRNEQNAARGVQRRRHRHHHHHHGAGVPHARRSGLARADVARADLPHLRPELRLHRHLLEQPPLSDSRGDARDAAVLWANLHLLFWLSLTPFVTGWMGHNHLETIPTATYGAVLFMAGTAYWILQQTIIAAAGPDSRVAQSIGGDFKGLLSIAPLRPGDRLCVRQPVGVGRDLRGRRADVVRAGSAIKADLSLSRRGDAAHPDVQLQPDVVVHAEQPEDSRDGDLVFREVELRGRLGRHRVAGESWPPRPMSALPSRRGASCRRSTESSRCRRRAAAPASPSAAAGRTRRADIDSSPACSRGQNRRASVRRS